MTGTGASNSSTFSSSSPSAGRGPPPAHHGCHTKNNDRTDNRLTNLAWKTWVENEQDKRKHGTVARGGRRVATPPDQVIVLRERFASGVSLIALAKETGLHRTSVARIVQGRRRRNVA